MCHVCNQSDQVFYDNLREILLDRLESEKIVKTIEDLGLLSEEQISKKGTPIDTVWRHFTGSNIDHQTFSSATT